MVWVPTPLGLNVSAARSVTIQCRISTQNNQREKTEKEKIQNI